VADAVKMTSHYVHEDSKIWMKIWIRRLEVEKIPNKKVKARILVGCARHVVTMPIVLRTIENT
jgi:hypothetical protein